MIKRRDFVLAGAAGVIVGLSPHLGFAEQLTLEQVFKDPDAPVLGNPDGDVSVVEFFDYQCPYCKLSHRDVKSVIAEDGNVRLVMKDWPVFGDVSVFASQAVLGANELGEYQKAMDALMATPGSLTEDDVKSLLTAAGIDFEMVGDAVRRNNKKISDLLTRNYKQALAFNFAGTPSFVIGKNTYAGLLTADQLRDAIAHARKV